jgi:hypothetical protein
MRHAIVIASIIASAGVAQAKPAKLRASAIPDGDGWSCSAASCEREAFVCGDACKPQPTAWVATAQDPKTRRWEQVAGPTAEACAARVAAELPGWKQISVCTEVGATAPVPPDKTLVPKGKGWFCFVDDRGQWPKRRPTPAPRRCFRDAHECTIRYHGIAGAGAVLGNKDSPEACVASATAFVFTMNDTFAAAATAGDCEAVRTSASDRTACAAFK